MHQAGKLVGFLGRDDVAVHDVQRIAVLPHVQPGERAPGAADGVEAAPLALVQQIRLLKRLLDDLLRLLDRLRRDVLQRKPAERERHAALGAMAVDFGEFERAAAEIAHDAARLVEAGHDAERRKLGLPLAGQHVDLDAADALGLGDEGLAVLGVAAGRGGDRQHLADLHAIAQRAEAADRGERLVDRVRGQEPGRLHLAAEPGQHLLVEDRGRTARQPLIDDEAHRVRADVDDRDRRPVIETTLRHVDCQSPPFNRGRGGV